MTTAERIWLHAQRVRAWHAGEVDAVDLINRIVTRLDRLQAVADAAAALNEDASIDGRWEALMDALSFVDTTEQP